jgi:hypothetical protein
LFPYTNEWSFVAMVVEPAKATLYLMSASTGISNAVNDIAQDSEEFGLGWHIGNDAADGGNGGRTMPGFTSAVSVFDYALTSNQLVGLYNAALGKAAPPTGVTITIGKGTGGNVVLAWPAGSLVEATNIAGPWTTNSTATSPYTVAPSGTQMFFEAH